MKDPEGFRWLRRRWREAARDNQWLLPALGALVGVLLAMGVGTGGGVETHKWTVTVDRSRDTFISALGLVFTALSIVLALASVAAQNVVGRFGSRTLRIYMRRSADRWVLGMFALAAAFILTEQFQLPNLKDKGKKRSLTRYTYDLTDRHRGFGQLLDKKATLRKIVETNITLGNLPDPSDIDPTRMVIQPRDKIYRVLSREKDFESQAMIFFLRDYSGSMSGKPTELVVSQHVLIYSWILYQYAGQVESRFILHDTEAREVPDFYTYYNSKVAGGTKVASAFHLVNEIVDQESLARDYNIYVFHGTDGDDWDKEGKETVPEIEDMLTYANRVGITVARNGYGKDTETEVETYLKASNLLDEQPELIRLDVMPNDADEPRLIEGIKKLIS